MNRFCATVTAIYEEQQLHIVEFDACGIPLRMMGLELPAGVEVGERVWLGCKPSHVIIAKNFSGEISLSNAILAHIVRLERGRLLGVVHLKTPCGPLESLITRASVDRMGLEEGMEVRAFIKASELSILEVCS